MEPPEKRNANSNDGPRPCQGGFPINYKSPEFSGQALLFHLVIIAPSAHTT
jgi:hypothetical protein